ncbi:protein phosphatase 2C domain-containing protein [Nocardia testacea]|uniref:protein phosphatase 2C domain-containing protein n=1 Tax=Nocardia testacea TaxID=248551 RepID=UPI003A852004
MKVYSAQLQEGSAEDRLLIADRGVIVLDGATSHDPAYPSAHSYVDTLGFELLERLPSPCALTDILSAAIESTAAKLQLHPGGRAPSSTVAMVRIETDWVETLVLGDSSVVVGYIDGTHVVISDERLDALGIPESQLYHEHLQAGGGYSSQHFDLLRLLQHEQRQRRNRPDGYWIAEADPAAGYEAIVRRYPMDRVDWVALATDGAAKPLTPLQCPWHEVANLDDRGLAQLLDRCHRWEAHTDPSGRLQPRSKRHDDKTLAIVRPNAADRVHEDSSSA